MSVRFIASLLAGASLIAALSLAAPAAGQEPPDTATIIARVEEARLLSHLEAIAVPRSILDDEIDELEAAGAYVEDELASYGYDVTLQDVEFDDDDIGNVASPNVIGIKEGTQCPDRIFVAGAHYDSVPDTPGADDDASGTAGMLEIARVLADVDLPATVQFTAFTLEEVGLVGSRAMARDLAAADAEVVGMYSLEMIGYTDPSTDSAFILALGNEASAPLLAAVERAKSLVPDLPIVTLAAAGRGETSPDTRRSDHAPFWDAGYQALLVTDTANFRNPNYHQPSDTIDTLDMPFATNVTKAMLATTLLYLTDDANNDGTADVCVDPLVASATPMAVATMTPTGTATAGVGVTPPSAGTGVGSRTGTPVMIVTVIALLAFVAVGAILAGRTSRS